MVIYDIMVKVSLMGKNRTHEPEIINSNYTINFESAEKILAGEKIIFGSGELDFTKKIAIFDGRTYKILNSVSVLKQIKQDLVKMEAIKTVLSDIDSKEGNDPDITSIDDPNVSEILYEIENVNNAAEK